MTRPPPRNARFWAHSNGIREVRMKGLRYLSTLTLALIPGSAMAMSVSWQGSTAVMVQNQPFLTDWLLAYSFRNDMAIAARYMRTVMTDGSAMKIYAPQLDWLVHRWNAP